jgi:hypothetical protein
MDPKALAEKMAIERQPNEARAGLLVVSAVDVLVGWDAREPAILLRRRFSQIDADDTAYDTADDGDPERPSWFLCRDSDPAAGLVSGGCTRGHSLGSANLCAAYWRISSSVTEAPVRL